MIPTRGDVPLGEIIESLAGFREIVVWDNSVETDLAVYGRYAAIERCTSGVIYTQDDDCVLSAEAIADLLANYEPGVLTANMPEAFRHDFYAGHCLLGFGSVFDRDLPDLAFARFHLGMQGDREHYSMDGQHRFFRTCDIAFAALTPRRLTVGVYRDLTWARADNRMYRQREHFGERKRMLDLALRVRRERAAA